VSDRAPSAFYFEKDLQHDWHSHTKACGPRNDSDRELLWQ